MNIDMKKVCPKMTRYVVVNSKPVLEHVYCFEGKCALWNYVAQCCGVLRAVVR